MRRAAPAWWTAAVTIRLRPRRAAAAAAALAAALAVAAGGSSSDDSPQGAASPGSTPMEASDAAPALRMDGLGLRGDPPNMRFARDTPRLDMSLDEDGDTVWSVTDGVPVRFSHDRPGCRYPEITPAEFDSIASQVLWSTTPPRSFPEGTWGFLGTRADADAGSGGAAGYTYDSGGRVTLELDVRGRPVHATAPRGPFTIVYGRYAIATVADAERLPACS
jgi:hypothetical protein